MAVKGWFDLTPEELKATLLHLHRRDIGQQRLSRVRLTSLLTYSGLNNDPEIRQHFKEEKIPLPPAVTRETQR